MLKFHQSIAGGTHLLAGHCGLRSGPVRMASSHDPHRSGRHWEEACQLSDVSTQRTSGGVDKELGGGGTFSMMSYNILADGLANQHARQLYPRTPRSLLEWQWRWKGILSEIMHYYPSILCLQEVDHFEQIANDLSLMGYDGQYVKRSGDREDGCATFWLSKCFKCMKFDKIFFNEHSLRDNVALLVVLEPLSFVVPKGKSVPLVVANTHILFNTKRGEVKLAQARILAQKMEEMMDENALGLLAGDFNSTPGSSMYKFITTGTLDCAECESSLVSGQTEGFGWRGQSAFGNRSRGYLRQPYGRQYYHKRLPMDDSMPAYNQRYKIHSSDEERIRKSSSSGTSLHKNGGDCLDLGTNVTDSQIPVQQPDFPHMSTTMLCKKNTEMGSCYENPAPSVNLIQGLHSNHVPSALGGESATRGNEILMPSPEQRSTYDREVENQRITWETKSQGEAQCYTNIAADNVLAPMSYDAFGTHDRKSPAKPVCPRTLLSRVQPAGWTLERLEMATGLEREQALDMMHSGSIGRTGLWLVQHPLQLSSSYMAVCGYEPEFTTVHSQAMTTVDFVFYTKNDVQGIGLKPVRALRVPARCPGCLPSRKFPSDHLFLLFEYWMGRSQ